MDGSTSSRRDNMQTQNESASIADRLHGRAKHFSELNSRLASTLDRLLGQRPTQGGSQPGKPSLGVASNSFIEGICQADSALSSELATFEDNISRLSTFV